MRQQELIETMAFTPKLVEEASDTKRMVVEGIFQKAGVKNANGRVYPRSLWERIIKDESLSKAMQERRMLGCLDHPEDGKSRLSRAAHIILTQKLDENGNVIGRSEVLDTPDGKVLQELFRAGVTVGISSRGSGTVKKNSMGEDIVNDDYVLETYDFVYNPSTIGATPKPVTESVQDIDNTTEENSMNAKEKYQALEAKANSVLAAKPTADAASRQVVEGAAADLMLDLSKLMTEAPEIKELASSLMDELKSKRKEFRSFVETFTQGTADTGIRRETPMEAPPPPGEGWPLNPGDAGPLADQVGNGAAFMQGGSKSVLGEAREDDDKENDDDEEDNKDKPAFMKESNDVLTSIAEELVALPESEDNSALRAFAAAYLLERYHRQTEGETFNAVIVRMQEKIQEAVKSGTLKVSGVDSTELTEKYDVALGVIEELSTRLRNISAKVYAEQELDKIGLKGDKEARKVVAEAIRTTPSKKAIDEAIAALSPVKGMKVPEEKKIEESVKKELPLKSAEDVAAKLTEDTPKSSGAALAQRLSESLRGSRSTK